MSATKRLAAFVAQTRYEDLSPQVREAAKRIILDTVGCALGAVPTDLGLTVQRLVHDQGGRETATVLGTGQRTSTMMAAYANGRLSNILDFDETFMLQGHHAHSALAGALAGCESAGLDGKALINAFAVGFEVGARVGRYFAPHHTLDAQGRAVAWEGLVNPPLGHYAASAAAASALRLNPEQVEHAFGLTASYLVPRVSWKRELDLPTVKYADAGWSAQAGVMAALMAREGITGVTRIFEGDDGLWKVVQSGDHADLDGLVDGLGNKWWLPYTSIKFWPVCRWLHYALTALQDVLTREQIAPEQIEAIKLSTFPQGCAMSCFANQEVTMNPVSLEFNYPHAAAMIALGVPPGPAWFTPEIVQSDAARALRHKVTLGVEPESQNPQAWGLEEQMIRVPSRAEVTVGDRVFTSRADLALGDPWQGAPAFSDSDLLAKFQRLAEPLAPLSDRWRAHVQAAAEQLLRLEEVSDLPAFLRSLSPVSGR